MDQWDQTGLAFSFPFVRIDVGIFDFDVLVFLFQVSTTVMASHCQKIVHQ